MNKDNEHRNQKQLNFLYSDHLRRQDRDSEPTLSVSIELTKHIYREKLITPFTTYLALKFIDRTGRISVSDAPGLLADTLGHRDQRSVKKAIKQCLELGWLNSDGEFYFVRAFHRLERMYQVKSRKAGVLKFSELHILREWILSYTLGARFKGLTSLRKARTMQRKNFVKARQVAISIISEELGLSRSAACELKQRAAKLNYFSYRNRIEDTGICPGRLHHARKMLDDDGLFIEDNTVIRKLTSEFKFNTTAPGKLRILHFKKRKSYAA